MLGEAGSTWIGRKWEAEGDFHLARLLKSRRGVREQRRLVKFGLESGFRWRFWARCFREVL